MMSGFAGTSPKPRPLCALCFSPGNAAKPGSDIAIFAERSRTCPCGKKCFLCHVVRVGIVSQKPAQKCPDCLLMPIDEDIERRFGAAANGGDEGAVIIAD